jgi:hypothetical protein
MRFMGLSALTPNQEDKGTSLCQIPCWKPVRHEWPLPAARLPPAWRTGY